MLRANTPAMIREEDGGGGLHRRQRVTEPRLQESAETKPGLGCIQCRKKSHREAYARRHQQRGDEQSPVELQIELHGHGKCRQQQRHESHGSRRRGHSQAPPDQTQTEALHDNLSDQPHPARAQGLSNRHLATANRRVGKQEAGDVGADDEQERYNQPGQYGQTANHGPEYTDGRRDRLAALTVRARGCPERAVQTSGYD